jgi:pyrroloquinoline quinone (PQQ) biosynthesis protein C
VTFFEELKFETAEARKALLASPVIVDCLAHRVGIETYRAFLVQAYHHVRHTVPLLMACGSRLPERLAWLQANIVEYITEEQGHEQWIRDDIEATGVDPEPLLAARPNLATELMVSFAYDTVMRGNPVGFFGMVLVLEGTSVALATQVASIVQHELGLPNEAFSYLTSHGSLDQEHIGDYEAIVNRLDDPRDRAAVIHCARAFYKLYADVFASLPRTPESAAADIQRRAVA